jgi:hypothetical protein
MTRRNRNRQTQNKSVGGTQASPTSVLEGVPETPHEPVQSLPQDKPARQAKLSGWKRFKRYAWRITGFYFWLRFVLWIAGEDDWLTLLGQRSSQWAISTLASFGYAPTGATHLPLVAKVGWILTVTEFSIGQLIGLFLYLLTFPVIMLFIIFFNEAFETTRANIASKEEKPHGLSSRRQSWPLFTIAAFGLLAWYLLYGDASTFRTIIPGVLFAFILLLLLAYRAFQRAKPASISDAAILNSLERNAAVALTGMTNNLADNLKKPRAELSVTLRVNSLQKWQLIRTAAFLRGKKGKDRVYIILVFQFAFSLLLLGVSAVLFWALVIRAVSHPLLSFSTCALIAMSHFLVGIETPHIEAVIPVWATLGPSITAFILFGVYVAAAASLLPGKQQAYAERASAAYLKLRLSAVLYGRMFRQLDRVLKSKK